MRIDISVRKIEIFTIILIGVMVFPIGLFELGFYLGFMKAKKGHILEPKAAELDDKPISSDLESSDIVSV
jgi:hypothetical protein